MRVVVDQTRGVEPDHGLERESRRDGTGTGSRRHGRRGARRPARVGRPGARVHPRTPPAPPLATHRQRQPMQCERVRARRRSRSRSSQPSSAGSCWPSTADRQPSRCNENVLVQADDSRSRSSQPSSAGSCWPSTNHCARRARARRRRHPSVRTQSCTVASSRRVADRVPDRPDVADRLRWSGPPRPAGRPRPGRTRTRIRRVLRRDATPHGEGVERTHPAILPSDVTGGRQS